MAVVAIPAVQEKSADEIQKSAFKQFRALRISDGVVKTVTDTPAGYVDNEGHLFKSPFKLPQGVDIVIF